MYNQMYICILSLHLKSTKKYRFLRLSLNKFDKFACERLRAVTITKELHQPILYPFFLKKNIKYIVSNSFHDFPLKLCCQ